jgi:carbamoyltransferase
VKDGILVAAAEEERFKRIKHWAGFPIDSLRYCLDEAKISLDDVHHIAVNSDPKANLGRKIIYSVFKKPNFGFLMDRLKNKRNRLSIKDELRALIPESNFLGDIHNIEHHLCHLSSSYHVSNFEKSIAISVDGFGDFSSAAWGICEKNNIEIDNKVYFPHSLGIFYQAMTQFLGFPYYGDEYKVMGMAAYGEPKYLDQLRSVVFYEKDGKFRLNLDHFIHHNTKVDYQWDGGIPFVGSLFHLDSLEELFQMKHRDNNEELQQQHFDLAKSTQTMYEEVFYNLLNATHSQYGIDNLSLAGGCAMNSLANGGIFKDTPYKKVYIQSAAGDAGGAIGAAYVVANNLGELVDNFQMTNAFYGPSFNNDYHEKLLNEKKEQLDSNNCIVEKIEKEKDLCKKTAEAIADGKVIGWFQGRMEWGPRALGNRSILCDPRREDIREILNLKIKRRESFRPFAPAILFEDIDDWFDENHEVPFMMQVFNILEDKQKIIPAVTHKDGTGRLQTVDQLNNPRYYDLIFEFKEITGVPIILNTSFNENEPVVCKPEEALETFLRTKMDLLVLGNWMVYRS